MNPYLALLRVEFTVPRTVARRAVRSYRTLSPLPDPACAGHRRFALCCTGRRLAPPRRYLAPCPMEPGLSSPPPVSPEGGRQPEVKRLKSLKESNARLTGLSLRSVAKTLSVMLEFIKPQKLT